MPIPSLCRTISSELSNNLRLAGSEQERSELAAETLEHMGDSLFPLLNRLKAETSEGDDEYRRAQAAVLDLLGMAGVTFLRGCARHGSGVMLLEELAGKCDDLQVKK